MNNSNLADSFYQHLTRGLDKQALCLFSGSEGIPARHLGWTALYAATKGNCVRTLEAMIEKGFNVNEANDEEVIMGDINDSHATPLFAAAAQGNTAAAEILLQHGADMDFADDIGITPLMLAAENGKIAMVRLLLEHGANIHAKDSERNSALHFACHSASGDMIRTLLAAGAERDARNDTGENALTCACLSDNVDALRALHEAGADLSGSGRDVKAEEETPLITACHSESWNAVLYLLDAGVAIDTADCYGSSPIHLATEKGARDIVKRLLLQGADIHARDGNGCQPIHLAAGHQAGMLTLLLATGADVHAISENRGLTPLHIAAMEGNEACIRILLQAGANVLARTGKGGMMPLHYAVQLNKVNLIHALLRAGADINACSASGRTPLFYACDDGSEGSVRCLLKVRPKADVNIADNKGQTPLDVAEEHGYINICKLLRAAGSRNGRGPRVPKNSFPRFKNMLNDLLASHGKDILQVQPPWDKIPPSTSSKA